MGLYANEENVKTYLLGKVRFTEDDDDENRMHVKFLRLLINEAESELEMDLSPRFSTPLVTEADQPFAKLPDRPTKQIIKKLAELKSVCYVLDSDFGRGSVENADKFKKSYEDRYKATLDKLMEKRAEGQGWKYPPLPGLKLNWFNKEADDGYGGSVLTTSQGDGGFPATRINDPSENYWNGTVDEGQL
jgi:hypothetical protein